MFPSLDTLFVVVPKEAFWVAGAAFLFAAIGYVAGVWLAIRRKKWVLLPAFPVTHPWIVFCVAVRGHAAGLRPLAFHVLALLVWFGGMFWIRQTEMSKLAAYEATLERGGADLSLDWLRETEADEADKANNIWDHPFLAPLAAAGRSSSGGEEARESLDGLYENLDWPRPRADIDYEQSPEGSPPRKGLFMDLHAMAVQRTAESASPDQAAVWPGTVRDSVRVFTADRESGSPM